MQTTSDPSQQHYATLLSKCIKTKNLNLGKSLHSNIIKTALNLNTFLANRIIDLYAKCNSTDSAHLAFNDLQHKNTRSWNTIISSYSKTGFFENAHQLLYQMPAPNVVTYNSIISGLNRRGFYKESVNLFKEMHKDRIGDNMLLMDEYTVVSVVNACARLRLFKWLSQVHGVALVFGLEFNVVVCNSLIDAYGECGEPEFSYLVFRNMNERDVVSWTSMVVAYARASRIINAQGIFEQMPMRNAVSWTALISGLVRDGEGDKALKFFSQMQEEGVMPTEFTYASVLGACADVAVLEKGKQVHGHIFRCGNSFDNVYVVNALVDMYCKCGDMVSARTLFEKSNVKDIVTWNSMITGFAQNGQAEVSLTLFRRMIESDVTPNTVTFLGVLAACSHSGLEFKGLRIFNMMEKDFGVQPELDHYAILIDLLGRKNRLQEALELIEKSPDGSDHIGMWGALLNACRVHGNVELARRAAEMLFVLEPRNTARYVMLANVYAAAGRWEDACQVRRVVDEKGLRKEAAYSWIEVRNTQHEFVTRDKSHTQIAEINDLLVRLVDQMKDVGYALHIGHSFLLENELP